MRVALYVRVSSQRQAQTQTIEQQLDLLRFQVNEIGAARLREGEDAELEQEHKRASNAVRLRELAGARTPSLWLADLISRARRPGG